MTDIFGSTCFFETYAMLTLYYCYDTSWTAFEKGESPDFYNIELNMGIEVVRAISRTKAVVDRIANEFFGKGLDIATLNSNVQKKHPNFKGNIREVKGIKLISSSFSYTNFSDHIDLVNECIIEKTKKLNKNYTLYKNNFLYIFARVPFMQHDIEYIIAIIKKEINIYEYKFDTYFINCINQLIIISYPEYHVQIIDISDKLLKDIMKEARTLIDDI